MQLVQLVGRLGSSKPHCPCVSIVVLFLPLHVGHPLGLAPEAALEDLGLPCEGQVRRWCSSLGRRVLAAPGTLESWQLGQPEGNGTPLQYSCLENPMDGGAW